MLTLLAAFSHTSVIIHSSYTYHHTFIIYSSYTISYTSKIAFLPPNASPSSPSLLPFFLPPSLSPSIRGHIYGHSYLLQSLFLCPSFLAAIC